MILTYFVLHCTNKNYQGDNKLREDDNARLKEVQHAGTATVITKWDSSEVSCEFDAKLCKFLLVCFENNLLDL